MDVLRVIANAKVFISKSLEFFEYEKLSSETDENKVFYRKLMPDYSNNHVEIYRIKGNIFTPQFFVVEVDDWGNRRLLTSVLEKAFSVSLVKILGENDFALAWQGDLKKSQNGNWEAVITSGGDAHWNVYHYVPKQGYRNVSLSLGEKDNVYLSDVFWRFGYLEVVSQKTCSDARESSFYKCLNGEYELCGKDEVLEGVNNALDKDPSWLALESQVLSQYNF